MRESVHEEGTYVSERKSEGVELTPEIVFEIGFGSHGGVPVGHFTWRLLVMALEIG